MSLLSEARKQFVTDMSRELDNVVTSAIAECFNIVRGDVIDFISQNSCENVVNPDKSQTYSINGVGVIRIFPTEVTFNRDNYTATASAKYELLHKESNTSRRIYD